MDDEPAEFSPAGRRCPRCDQREADLSVRACRSCGQLFVEMLRHSMCPSCGASAEERDICRLCGTSLIIGPPLAECFPQKPYSEGVKPALLLRQVSTVPAEIPGAPAWAFEEHDPSAHPEEAISGIILTTDPDQTEGIPQDHVRLAVGETVTVFVRGQDPEGKWRPLPEGIQVKWRSDRELELSSKAGEKVTARLVSEPKVSALATARAVVHKKRMQKLFTVEKK